MHCLESSRSTPLKELLAGLFLLLQGTVSTALEFMPYPLAPGMQPGDVHMGIRILDSVELPAASLDGFALVELSALGFDADEDLLYALSDHGRLFHLRMHLVDDRIASLQLLAAYPLRDAQGSRLSGIASDSEGLAVVDGDNGHPGDARLIVSFERAARVAEFRPDGTLVRDLGLPPALPRGSFASANRALEAVTVDGEGTVLTAPESPFRSATSNTVPIAAFDGRWWQYPLRSDGSAVVAMESLPDGRLLVLERLFNVLLYRLETSLRITPAPSYFHTGALLPVQDVAVMDSLHGWRVDNFEGLARIGDNRFVMVSDNNENAFQRTLLVVFELQTLDSARDPAYMPKFEPVQQVRD